MITHAGRAVGNAIRSFFFARERPYGLALVRIALPLVIIYDLYGRWPFVRELYSADGAPAPLWDGYGLEYPFPILPGAVAVALFSLLLASLLTASLGWMTRMSLVIATVLYFYFTSLDAMSTMTKYTVIANHGLLLLSLSRCGAVASIDALRRAPRDRQSALWPQRLVQLFVGIVYLGGAMTKLHTEGYFSGDQLMWWLLTHVNAPHPVGEWLASYPAVLSIGSYASLVWEMTFLFLIWRGFKKYLMLALGVGFHVGTYLLLGLDIFPWIMIALYFAFFDEREIRSVLVWGRRQIRRWRLPAFDPGRAADALAPAARRFGPVAFGLVVWCAALGGAGLERVMDPYNVRGPDGPMPLQKIDAERAERMLSGGRPLRLKDMVFAFDLGTDLFGQTLIGRTTTFELGQTLFAQCKMAPPHPDMYVECNLFTADGEIVDRQGLILARGEDRLTFSSELGSALSPGEYELALCLSGEEVARRSFTIVP